MKARDFERSKENGGAVLNTNNEALAAYKRTRELRWKNEVQEDRLNKLENELSEIKDLLHKILEK